MRAIVDMDILAYKASFSCQKSAYSVVRNSGGVAFEGGSSKEAEAFIKEHSLSTGEGGEFTKEKTTNLDTVEEMQRRIDKMISTLITRVGCTEMEGYLTGVNNFREKVATTKKYKGNRDKIAKPVHLNEAKAYLIKEYGAVMCNGWEADDAMACAQKEYAEDGLPSVICSIDKDLLTVEGWHFNLDKHEWRFITEEEAGHRLCIQILTGDSTDNIGGLPRVGEKGAEKILKGCATTEEKKEKVVLTYQEKAGKQLTPWVWDKYLLEQANLIYIRANPHVGLNTLLREDKDYADTQGDTQLGDGCTVDGVVRNTSIPGVPSVPLIPDGVGNPPTLVEPTLHGAGQLDLSGQETMGEPLSEECPTLFTQEYYSMKGDINKYPPVTAHTPYVAIDEEVNNHTYQTFPINTIGMEGKFFLVDNHWMGGGV
jgi:hypothetical protein